jgi:nicotinamide-nucleotide amidase
MKPFKAEIIAVGTELLLGQIANTNAQWISSRLAAYGIHIYNHFVVGDNLERVESAFSQAQTRSDIIIVTGGLGPTEDDMTREAFHRVSNLEVVEHTPSMKKIEHYFAERQKEMTPNNRRQARIFKGAQVLDNQVGMAPGMILDYKDKTWIFLPGVPKEMKQLISNDVLPYLQKLTGREEIIKSLVLKFIGIGESSLEHELRDLIHAQTNPTIAPLAQQDGIVIRLTAKERTDDQANALLESMKQQILKRVGDYFYGVDDDTVEQQVIKLLKAHRQSLAAAESLTGGMFTSRLISVDGASEVCPGGIVSYDNKVKQHVLGVSEKTIQTNGTVSEACALEMAINVRKQLDTTIGISFTGVAGTEEVEGHPVGTVFMAICNGEERHVNQYLFQGDRNEIRRKTVLKGLENILKTFKPLKP